MCFLGPESSVSNAHSSTNPDPNLQLSAHTKSKSSTTRGIQQPPQGTEIWSITAKLPKHKITQKRKESYPKGRIANIFIAFLYFKFMVMKWRAYAIRLGFGP